MELGAERVLHAVHRPDTSEVFEMARLRRMPVPRGNNRQSGRGKTLDVTIDCQSDPIPLRHGKRPTGTKIVLHVDNH
jgi:hypothetical protein